MSSSNMNVGSQADRTLSLNMTLLSHHELEGFGGVGEGVAMQVAKDGRRIMWLAHESAPKNFTAVDVSDPRSPKMIVQTDLPHAQMRSNSLEVYGDILAVAYQTKEVGVKPAGFELFDISVPEKPRSIVMFDASGPHSRGAHCLWFVDGETVHMASGAPDFQPRNPKDDQFYRIIDVRTPSKPTEVGRWWYPGTREGDSAPPPRRMPKFDSGYRAHNTNVYPQRPDRAYIGYIDGGAIILDISDRANPKLVSNWKHSPPNTGFTHTAMPLFEPQLLIVTDECTKDDGADWPKMTWVVDNRDETNPVPISTLPLPPVDAFAKRGGRFGSHNLHENPPVKCAHIDERIILATFFNGGMRAYDLSNPYQPTEVAYFVPGAPKMSPKGAVQINDVYWDDRGIVYCVDRFAGGLYTLEMKI
jgi:hypothetical protein